MHVEPFACYRPAIQRAASFVTPGNADNPRSFSAIDLPLGEKDDEASRALHDRVFDGTLVRDGTACLYLWRRSCEGQAMTAVVAALAVADLASGDVTVPACDPARARALADRILATGCQTRPVTVSYPDNPALATLVDAATYATPTYELELPGGVRHTVWRVARDAATEALELMFGLVQGAGVVDGADMAAAAGIVAAEAKTPESGLVLAALLPSSACAKEVPSLPGGLFDRHVTAAENVRPDAR